MTNIAQAAWISGCIFLTQGTVPNLHQIHFFLFCVPPALPQKKDEEIALKIKFPLVQ